MAAPTRLPVELIAIGTGTPRSTAAMTLAVGDVVAVTAGTGDQGETLAISNSGTATLGAWTLRQDVNVVGWGREYVWTTTITGAGTLTVTLTRTAGSGNWSASARPFRGSDGVGASSKTNSTGAPSLALTTTQVNSAIVVGNADWNAVDGAARTWRTVNGAGIVDEGYGFVSGATTNYSGTYADAGTIAAKTVGLSAPVGQKYSIVAVEIFGSAGTTPITGSDSATVTDTGTVSATAPGSESSTGTDAATASVTASGSDTSAGTDTGAVSASASGSDSATGTDAGTASVTATGSDSGTGTDSGTVTDLSATPISGSDSATGSDTGTASVTAPGSDAATTTDAGTVSATLTSSDAATGTDAGTVLDVSGVVPVTGSDTASATDAGALVDLTPAPQLAGPTGGRYEPDGDESSFRDEFRALADSDLGIWIEEAKVVDLTPPAPPEPLRFPMPARTRRGSGADSGTATETARVLVLAGGADMARGTEAGEPDELISSRRAREMVQDAEAMILALLSDE